MPKRYGKARTAQNKLVARIRRKNVSKPGFIGVVTDFELTTADGKAVHLKPGALFSVGAHLAYKSFKGNNL